ncbi:hypothetical protein EDD11_009738 [Mortierella claussenii]|nr:hypothetical protein EDD11_009738 [Mortierella claussenii]
MTHLIPPEAVGEVGERHQPLRGLIDRKFAGFYTCFHDAKALNMPKRLATPQIVIEDAVKRDAGDIKRNEYCMLVHVYRQMLTLPKEVRETFGPGIRSQLANLTGVGDTTAQKAITFSKKGEVPQFSSTSNAGRPVKVLDDDYAAKVREIVARKLPEGQTHMTVVMIQEALLNEYGIRKTTQTLRRDMLKLDLRWTGERFVQGRGKKANPKPPSTWPKHKRSPKKELAANSITAATSTQDGTVVVTDAATSTLVPIQQVDVEMTDAQVHMHGQHHHHQPLHTSAQLPGLPQVEAQVVAALEAAPVAVSVAVTQEQMNADAQAQADIAARVQALLRGETLHTTSVALSPASTPLTSSN